MSPNATYLWAAGPWQFSIVNEPWSGAGWSLRIMRERADADGKVWSLWLRSYETPAAAADAVLRHTTGNRHWDACEGNPQPPAGLNAWDGPGHAVRAVGG